MAPYGPWRAAFTPPRQVEIGTNGHKRVEMGQTRRVVSRRSSAAVPGGAPVGTAMAWAETYAAAILEAKHLWLKACSDGSSPARVQRLYEAYRELVIRQAAIVVQGSSAHAS